jgi:hypothetical protein
MQVNQGFERILIPTRPITLQELPISQTAQRPVAEQPVDLPQDDPTAHARHRLIFPNACPINQVTAPGVGTNPQSSEKTLAPRSASDIRNVSARGLAANQSGG